MQSAHVIQCKGVHKMLTNPTHNEQQTRMISIQANDIMYTFKKIKKKEESLKQTYKNQQSNKCIINKQPKKQKQTWKTLVKKFMEKKGKKNQTPYLKGF